MKDHERTRKGMIVKNWVGEGLDLCVWGLGSVVAGHRPGVARGGRRASPRARGGARGGAGPELPGEGAVGLERFEFRGRYGKDPQTLRGPISAVSRPILLQKNLL